MDILKMFLENWDDVFVVILIIILIVLITIKWYRKFKDMSIDEQIDCIKQLLNNLLPIALKLVTDAEITFGSGTGKLKRSYVIDELYSRIPDEYKIVITEENLNDILESALEEAKLLWENNTNIQKLIKTSPIIE